MTRQTRVSGGSRPQKFVKGSLSKNQTRGLMDVKAIYTTLFTVLAPGATTWRSFNTATSVKVVILINGASTLCRLHLPF